MNLSDLTNLARLLRVSFGDIQISADETAKGAVAVIYFPWPDNVSLEERLDGRFDNFGNGNGRGWINIAD